MRPEIFLPLAFLFIACGVPSNAQNGAVEPQQVTVRVRAGAPLTVECSVRVEQRVEWRLDGGAVPADLAAGGEAPAGGRLAARLHASHARPHHAGLYTCSRDAEPPAQRVLVQVLASAAASGEGEATTTAAAPAEAAAGVRAGPGAVAGAAAGAGAAADGDVVLYEVGRTFTLNCSSGALSYVWKKNATALESVWELAERYELDENGGVFRLTKRSVEDDFGNYTCEPAGGATRTFVVRGRPHAKLPSDTNVVEDTKLKIVCRVTGKPHPGVTWSFNNDTAAAAEGAPGLEVRAALGDRVTLAPNEQGVPDAELVVEAAQRSDAGVYTCTPAPAGPGAGAASTPAATTLRVKDKYAALWPFLGICAEVFVLCAIILVYEKRRTKPELDDSDTDNHDQKKS